MTEKSIGYCGLICEFCCPDGSCNCKTSNRCKKQLSTAGCYQYNCCTLKGIQGCWQCNDAPCGFDMLAQDKIKMRAFVRCIKEDGIEKFIEYIERNRTDGVIYHRNGFVGDYDLDTEVQVLSLLKQGKSQ